ADNGLRRIFKLMIPRTLGLVAGQVNLIVLNALATTVGVGSVALLTIANNFQYLPIALVGISAAVAAFPTLSRDALQQDRSIFIRRLNYILKRLLWLIIPASIVFYLLVDWILRILLQTGYFQAADVTILGQVLRMFILGIWAQTLIPTLARAFYALQNTITPVVISIASIAVNIGLAYYFVSVLGWELSGLGLAFSMAGILNVALLWIFLWRKLRQS
ncbi:MAG TPA: lipid II flippase MurJ, partial [Candidatus Paceibacterota bacterium]|nr:lipid II flippase MurJ [Candidatus Paceibacterota bacterium]